MLKVKANSKIVNHQIIGSSNQIIYVKMVYRKPLYHRHHLSFVIDVEHGNVIFDSNTTSHLHLSHEKQRAMNYFVEQNSSGVTSSGKIDMRNVSRLGMDDETILCIENVV